MREFSRSEEDVRHSGRSWVAAVNSDPDLARQLVRRTTFWLEDTLHGDFYPSKWVGFRDMGPDRYRRSVAGEEGGDWFNGTAARLAVERSVGTTFGTPSQGQRERLESWACGRLTGVLDRIRTEKWQFLALDSRCSGVVEACGEGFWRRYDEAWSYYQATWVTYNDVLYSMCRDRPGHSALPDVVAKVGIVARAYAAGLERHGDPDGPGAVVGVARALTDNCKEVDALVSELKSVAGTGEVVGHRELLEVVRVHGRIQALVASATRSSVRSWVSKYLHFHAPGVPIFDSRARGVLEGRYDRRKARNRHFRRPDSADYHYWSFCNRFLSMWLEARSHGLDVSVRRLDQYLLYLADSGT